MSDDVPPSVGALHLHRAWARLRDERADAGDPVDLERVIAPWVPPPLRAETLANMRWLEADAPSETDLPPRTLLLEQVRLFERAFAPADPAATFESKALRTTLAVWALLVVGMIGSAILSFVGGPTGPWRVEWYANPDLAPPGYVRHTKKVFYSWDKRPPFPGFLEDEWSAVFSTCLVIPEAIDAHFELGSDDGSRLFVDGIRWIDNWGLHTHRTRKASVPLAAGTHALRVEYFESTLEASLQLEAAFGPATGKAKQIPTWMLQRPSDDPEAPCGPVPAATPPPRPPS